MRVFVFAALYISLFGCPVTSERSDAGVDVDLDAGVADGGALTSDAGTLDAGSAGPTLARLFGGRGATTAVPFQVRVLLDAPAVDSLTITWSVSDDGVVSSPTSTIAAGDTGASADVTWAAAGRGTVARSAPIPERTCRHRAER